METRGKYVEAIVLLDKAIEKNPENIHVLTKAKTLGDPDAQEMIDKYCTKINKQ